MFARFCSLKELKSFNSTMKSPTLLNSLECVTLTFAYDHTIFDKCCGRNSFKSALVAIESPMDWKRDGFSIFKVANAHTVFEMPCGSNFLMPPFAF